ncbi:hypothetical protein EDB85DRAFT_2160479 [Lactarius pseudohatsudake]|nr:hypothetical protein EDB85DRAFT_2160479 [Lactarius pseudohatsudake]
MDPVTYAQFSTPPTSQTVTDGVVPMDIDAIHTRPFHHLTEAEKEQCKNENRCFACRQKPGHLSPACPLPRKTRVATINEVSLSPTPITTATSVLQAALTLSPSDRFHVLNSLALLDDDDTPEELNNGHQINALYLPSPSPPSSLALFPTHDTFTHSPLQLLSSPCTPFTRFPDPPLDLSLALDTSPPTRSSYLPDASPCLVLSAVLAVRIAPASGVKTSKSSVFDFLTPVDEPPRQNQHNTTALTTDNADEFDFEVFYTSYMDDNNLIEGVKTSVLTSDTASPKPSLPYYPPIFPPHAFEQPRDPDEVTPVARITCRRSTTPTAPHPPPTAPPVANQNHADTVHHRLRATAAEFVPKPAITRPTQVHNVQLALQQPASNLTHIPQNIIGTGRPARNNPQPDANTVAQHEMTRTLRQRPRIRSSQIRDRRNYAEQILTPARIDATAAIRERINTWRNQIIPEATSRSPLYAIHQLSSTHDGHFTFAPDPRKLFV